MRQLLFLLTLTLSVQPLFAAQPAANASAKDEKPKVVTVEEQSAAEAAFKAGIALSRQEKFKEALPEFQKALKILPNDPGVLWNAALSAQLSGNFKLAAEYYAHDEKEEPTNGQLLAKMVQVQQALGELKQRDAYRAKVFAMYKSGKDTSGYFKLESYCRDQFKIGNDDVFVFERFEFKPKRGDAFAVRYEFMVFGPASREKPRVNFETGWNVVEKDGHGGFKPGSELAAFYLDAYFPLSGKPRQTYGLLSKEPTYDELKKRLIRIINEKAPPQN